MIIILESLRAAKSNHDPTHFVNFNRVNYNRLNLCPSDYYSQTHLFRYESLEIANSPRGKISLEQNLIDQRRTLFENARSADKAGESINWGTLARVYHPRGGWPGHLLFTYNSWRGVTRPDRPQLTRDQLFFDGHGLFPNTWPRSTR